MNQNLVYVGKPIIMGPSLDLPPNILSCLDNKTPRYTSYPSANHFYKIGHTFKELWLSTLSNDQSIALYIHIPFCPKLCWYCGCHTKMTHRYEPIKAYMEILLEEFRILATHLPHKPKLHSIHFGGGSPTILALEDMTRLFYAIENTFEILADAEIAIEIDPRFLTRHKAKTYAEIGFNRVSLGIQDFDEKVQKTINRVQSFEVVLEAITLLREYGIYAINMDLIYGLPFQTLSSIQETIEKIIRLTPSRIAYYSYAHMPLLKKHQRLIPLQALPNTIEKTRSYMLIRQLLEGGGYQSIGMDHFAKPEDALFVSLQHKTLRRNFMGYTSLPNDYIIGMGVSAISEMGQGIVQNSTQFLEYKRMIQAGKLPAIRGWEYGQDDYVRKIVINQLMCYFEADLNDILSDNNYPLDYFDKELAQLKSLEKTGMISIAEKKICFYSPARALIRSIAMIFDAYATIQEKEYSQVA